MPSQPVAAQVAQLLKLDAVLAATSEEIMSMLIPMVRGDTRPTLEFTVRDQNGAVINITGATVRLRISNKSTGAVLITRVLTITDGPGGKCTFAWVSTDWNAGVLDAAGHYDAELEVTFSDATVGTVFPVYDLYCRNQVG